jgi:hypothetical protein
MVTFAQAQERAERWVNGDVPDDRQVEVCVREFDLGFVAWAEPAAGDGSGAAGSPGAEAPRARLVIARDSGDTTLWPGLPVGEVIRRYEEEYGSSAVPAPRPAPPPQRLDLEATSFLLTPPEWLQQAADQMGIPDRRGAAGSPSGAAGTGAGAGGASDAGPGAGAGTGAGAPPGTSPAAGVSPWDAADTSSSGGGEAQAPPATVFAPPLSGDGDGQASADAKTELMREGPALPRTAVSPAVDGPQQPGQVPQGQGPGVPGAVPPPPPMPPNVPPPPPGSAPGGGDSGGSGGGAGDVHHAATMLAGPSTGGSGGSGGIGAPPPPPGPPGAVGSGGADADTGRAPAGGQAGSGRSRGGGPSVPPPPGAPGTPGAAQGGGSGSASGPPGGGYVPTQMVSADEVSRMRDGGDAANGPNSGPGSAPDSGTGGSGSGGPGPGGDDSSGGSGGTGDVHHAATMLAGPSRGGPSTPAPPGPPPAAPGAPPGPPPPGPPGAPQGYGFPQQGPPPGAPPAAGPPPVAPAGPVPAGAPPAYGYPQQQPPQQQQPTGLPTVGPGYMAVLRYRAPDGSEQQLIRRSAPGTPHPEWQILHELRNLNVPPQQVVELHTELESCELPGGYCARMIRETWPQVRVTHTAPYGRDHATRQQGMRHLIEHQGELHQVADGPARPAPCRVPLPPQHQIPPVPPLPPDAVGQELTQAFGPQAVFRFDQHAVSRQGVPDIVGQTLVWAGLPVDVGPFFWGQTQPGRPVPTLAELAQERGVRPAADAGSYLVMGNDFGKQLCVQYGTANIVAVPLEAGPEGQPAQPQFVSTGLPEFVRSLALLGRMWPLRYGLTQEQAGRWTVDFQAQLAALDPAALSSPENWWAVLLEQMWDGLF